MPAGVVPEMNLRNRLHETQVRDLPWLWNWEKRTKKNENIWVKRPPKLFSKSKFIFAIEMTKIFVWLTIGNPVAVFHVFIL